MTEQTAERPTRRRALRRLAIVVTVLLTLPVWYVAAWLTAAKAFTWGYITNKHADTVSAPFKPLIAYADSHRPGAAFLQRVYCHSNWEWFSSYSLDQLPPADDGFRMRSGFLSPDIQGAVVRQVFAERDAEN